MNVPFNTSISSPLFSRQIGRESVYAINASFMSQAVDVNFDFAPAHKEPAKGLPGYFIHGVNAAIDEIRHCSQLGITKISLRFVSSAVQAGDVSAGLSKFSENLLAITTALKDTGVDLIVDPFGLGLNADGKWGVRDENDVYDRDATHALLEGVGRVVSEHRVYGVVTLGRIPEEVFLTKRGIQYGGGSTKIFSFSQNSETSTAYVYLDSGAKNTGQKVMPGNVNEMNLWALADIWHGTNVSVVKPMESFHLMTSLSYLCKDDESRCKFLDSAEVKYIVQGNDFLYHAWKEMLSNKALLAQKCHAVSLAGYTVSGTTYMISLLAREKGDHMARARLAEMWVTAVGALDGKLECLIDRNALSYFEGAVLR